MADQPPPSKGPRMTMDLTRRQLLQRASIVGAFSALAANSALGQLMRAPRLIPWRNWSGGQSVAAGSATGAENLDELTTVIRQAQGKIRPVGSAHSFSALVPTDGTLLSLSYFTGLLDHDAKTLQAEFAAGTPMSRMGVPLKGVGQALQNMADIDYQTLAGAIATSTHWHRQNLSVLLGARLRHATGDGQRRGARLRQ